MRNAFAAIALAVGFAASAMAAVQTVTLSVSGMTCAACPITVKHALNKVKGVTKVDASYEKKQAVVSFDDAQTNAQELTRATTNAGFPSTVKQ